MGWKLWAFICHNSACEFTKALGKDYILSPINLRYKRYYSKHGKTNSWCLWCSTYFCNVKNINIFWLILHVGYFYEHEIILWVIQLKSCQKKRWVLKQIWKKNMWVEKGVSRTKLKIRTREMFLFVSSGLRKGRR